MRKLAPADHTGQTTAGVARAGDGLPGAGGVRGYPVGKELPAAVAAVLEELSGAVLPRVATRGAVTDRGEVWKHMHHIYCKRPEDFGGDDSEEDYASYRDTLEGAITVLTSGGRDEVQLELERVSYYTQEHALDIAHCLAASSQHYPPGGEGASGQEASTSDSETRVSDGSGDGEAAGGEMEQGQGGYSGKRVVTNTLRSRSLRRVPDNVRRITSLPELIMDGCTMSFDGEDTIETLDGLPLLDNKPMRVLEDLPLFIGSAEAAHNHTALAEAGISHVLSVGSSDVHALYPPHMSHHRVGLRDSPNSDLIGPLAECFPFIDEALALDSPGAGSESGRRPEGGQGGSAPSSPHGGGGNAFDAGAGGVGPSGRGTPPPADGGRGGRGGVLVHCVAGVSRSAAVVLAYLMARLGLPLQAALERLRSVRPQISPNSGFLMQLEELERHGGDLSQVEQQHDVWKMQEADMLLLRTTSAAAAAAAPSAGCQASVLGKRAGGDGFVSPGARKLPATHV